MNCVTPTAREGEAGKGCKGTDRDGFLQSHLAEVFSRCTEKRGEEAEGEWCGLKQITDREERRDTPLGDYK